MTPVFSEREIANIQSTKKVCGNCEGKGKVVAQIPTRFAQKNYANGYATFLIRCSFCGGSGAVEAKPVADGKNGSFGRCAMMHIILGYLAVAGLLCLAALYIDGNPFKGDR